MNDAPTPPGYDPRAVRYSIDEADQYAYAAMGPVLDREADVLLVQHEYGIFGGEAGAYLLDLLAAMSVPVVVTLHTILERPTAAQAAVLQVLLDRCARAVVMAERGRELLLAGWKVDPSKVDVVPHGIPERPYLPPASMRSQLGWPQTQTLLTFGLLSPGKGIETMIEAMPQLVKRHPDMRYVVLGVTHPHVLRCDPGDPYRASLIERACALGVEDNVEFIDRFVDNEHLCNCLQASDVYVSPYLSKTQITSGTLAYASGLGVPVVATRYWHAAELLRARPEQLVEPHCPDALARAVGRLLDDDIVRLSSSRAAYDEGRSATWTRVGERYAELLRATVNVPPQLVLADRWQALPSAASAA